MKKLCINGQQYINLRTLEREIARLKKTIDWNDKYQPLSRKERNIAKLAWGDIVRFIHKEELEEALKNAHSPEEINAVHRSIMELPGDWVVARFKESESDDPEIDLQIDTTFFCELKDGKPVFSDCADDAMWFDYKSKAEEIAELCGEDFEVCDWSPEASEKAKRLIKAIFGNSEEEERK